LEWLLRDVKWHSAIHSTIEITKSKIGKGEENRDNDDNDDDDDLEGQEEEQERKLADIYRVVKSQAPSNNQINVVSVVACRPVAK
jgi:hypothetical protein